MTQTFVDVTDTSSAILAAGAPRGTTTFVNYGSAPIWLGFGVDATPDSSLVVPPNGSSFIMSLDNNNVFYGVVNAIHAVIGPQQLMILQDTPTTLDIENLHQIGASMYLYPRAPLEVASSTTMDFVGSDPVNNERYNYGFAYADDLVSIIVPVTGRYLCTFLLQIVTDISGSLPYSINARIHDTPANDVGDTSMPLVFVTITGAYNKGMVITEFEEGAILTVTISNAGDLVLSTLYGSFVIQYLGKATNIVHES